MYTVSRLDHSDCQIKGTRVQYVDSSIVVWLQTAISMCLIGSWTLVAVWRMVHAAVHGLISVFEWALATTPSRMGQQICALAASYGDHLDALK